eukprot:TRINITY_DN15392_c0_g1_i1.p1 TRINITY_DN15392_c0_g1~~TRINITY_DN15392_c0_g1_i1.p1  ORF type:complete len:785 (-),score=61.12 TRINITY_DN15392_c0_g1_i1:557-2911(-)
MVDTCTYSNMGHQRAAEMAALEWKLRETRRRHAEELASMSIIGNRSTGGMMDAAQPHATTSGLAVASDAFCQRVGFGAERLSGPTLVTKRRVLNNHTYRLWVEDLGSAGGARVHAMDEESTIRAFSDIPDAVLSWMLATYQQSKGGQEAVSASENVQADDCVDEFLEALLGATCVLSPTHGDTLELRLPAHIPVVQPVPTAPASPLERSSPVEVTMSQPLQHGQHALPKQGLSNTWLLFPFGGNCVDSTFLPRGNAAVAAKRSVHDSRPAQTLPQHPCRRDGSPQECQWDGGTPRLMRVGPDGGGADAGGVDVKKCTCVVDNLLWPVPPSRVSNEIRAFGHDAFFGVRSPGGRAGAGPTSVSTSKMRTASDAHSSISSASKPTSRRTLVRPQSAPHRAAGQVATSTVTNTSCIAAQACAGDGCAQARTAVCRPSTRAPGAARPQSARHSGRRESGDISRLARAGGRQTWPQPPAAGAAVAVVAARRVRPSSAKASKHRRVIDDGVDSIIYEDVEGEEDMSEPGENVSQSVVETIIASGVEDRSARARGSTGGWSSCSSSIHGSISSRSVSRSRRPASAGPAGASNRNADEGRSDRSISSRRSPSDTRRARPVNHREVRERADEVIEAGQAAESSASVANGGGAGYIVADSSALSSGEVVGLLHSPSSSVSVGVIPCARDAEQTKSQPLTASSALASASGRALIPRPPAEKRPSGVMRPGPHSRMALNVVDSRVQMLSVPPSAETTDPRVAEHVRTGIGVSVLGHGPRASSPPPRRVALSGDNQF